MSIRTPIYKFIDSKWFIQIEHVNYGTDVPSCKNVYNFYIRYNYKDFIWTDIDCTYNRSKIFIKLNQIKKEMIKNRRLKPYRMLHSRK